MDETLDLRRKRVWVAGHTGMVGAALMRRLEREDCALLVARPRIDLRRQADTEAWLQDARPEVVFVAAATVGGILANTQFPADFLYDNLMIEANVIHGAFKAGVRKLIFLGSSCIYPKLAEQPIRESSLLSGPLEPTNAWYAVAKIAGVKLCDAYRAQHGADFISAMPSNLYGPGDNFDLNTSHVLPALIRKAHEAVQAGAPSMTIWGTGTPAREFLHVDDCADALVLLARRYSAPSPINVGSGEDVTIMEVARLVASIVGFHGDIVTDRSKPDGTPRKLMCADRIRALGWTPSIDLRSGILSVYRWFLETGAATSRAALG